MIFSDLAIHVGDNAEFPDGYSERNFYSSTYHVQQGFLIHLLREIDNEHFLPDAAKLNVIFGPDGDSSDYSCCLGVANVHINKPDFAEFFALDCEDQDRWILGHLCHGLNEAAAKQDVSCDAAERALKRVDLEGLLLRYNIKKLSKSHPSRKLRFNVVRAIQRGGESWYVEVCDRVGTILESFPILENTFYIRASGALRKSKWRGDTFLLTDSGGRVTFQKSSKRLLKKYA